jgi:hypothetical protein
MVSTSEVVAVETEDEYVHVRFSDPDKFEQIRTPDWAQRVAESVSKGAEVRTGKEAGADDWEIQSVLIDKHVREQKAKEQATKIVETIES